MLFFGLKMLKKFDDNIKFRMASMYERIRVYFNGDFSLVTNTWAVEKRVFPTIFKGKLAAIRIGANALISEKAANHFQKAPYSRETRHSLAAAGYSFPSRAGTVFSGKAGNRALH